MLPSLLHQLFSERLCQRLGTEETNCSHLGSVSCSQGLLCHILSFITFLNSLDCRQLDSFTAEIIILIITCRTILQLSLSQSLEPLHIFPSHTLGLSETLFITSRVSNLLPVNLITCQMIHQLFPVSISQLLQSFVL